MGRGERLHFFNVQVVSQPWLCGAKTTGADGSAPAPCTHLIDLLRECSFLSLEAPHCSTHLGGASAAVPMASAPGVEELVTLPVCAKRGWMKPIKPPKLFSELQKLWKILGLIRNYFPWAHRERLPFVYVCVPDWPRPLASAHTVPLQAVSLSMAGGCQAQGWCFALCCWHTIAHDQCFQGW